MIKTFEAVFDGAELQFEEPLGLTPNTRVRITLETLPEEDISDSFLRTAMSLKLKGPSDFSQNLDHYLYGHPKTEDE